MVEIIITNEIGVRSQLAVSIDHAVVTAMVNKWTCKITLRRTGKPPPSRWTLDMVPQPDRIVTLSEGRVTSAEQNTDLDYWISCLRLGE